MSKSLFDFVVKDLRGKEFNFSSLKGKVLMVVNVASKCGFTSQYKGLEDLYKKHKDAGLTIVAFPCNQFGGQEPGQAAEIEACQLNFGVSFPVMEKIEVNGSNTAPIYEFLKAEKPGILGIQMIKWNFEKFLINREGQVVERFASISTPESIEPKIAKLLAESA